MIIKTITCSGVNENNDIQEVVDFLKKYKSAELGIQCSPQKASYQTPRFEWLQELVAKLNDKHLKRRIALHLNGGFATSFCEGRVPDEINTLLHQGRAVGRLQLNFKVDSDVLENGQKVPSISDIHQSMAETYPHQIIFSANQPNLPWIQQLYYRGDEFDVLFDDSFGEGIMPVTRQKPLFKDIFQGYAGGLSPENVSEELDKINKVTQAPIFIDAEGRLKENGSFSFSRAEKYVQNALLWQVQNERARFREKTY